MTWATVGDGLRQAGINVPEHGTRLPRNMGGITSFASEEWRRRATAYGAGDEAVEKYLTEGLRSVERLHKYAESPIECALAPWLVFSNYPGARGVEPTSVYCPKDGIELEAVYSPVIIPQFAFVKYRADFAIVCGPPARRRHIVIVECDGDDAHGGPANFERDRKRDGLFAAFGIETVRAGGTEIYTNPHAVMERIARAFVNAKERER